MTLTPERISEAKRVCRDATPGPWRINRDLSDEMVGPQLEIWAGPSTVAKIRGDEVPGSEEQANAAFIALTRDLLPELIDTLEKVREIIMTTEGTNFYICSSGKQLRKLLGLE